VSIGLYPYYAAGQAGVSVVLRGVDGDLLAQIAMAVEEHIVAIGGALVERPQG